jgi:hypothetical protein
VGSLKDKMYKTNPHILEEPRKKHLPQDFTNYQKTTPES